MTEPCQTCTLAIVIQLLGLHYLGDFLLQPHWMATDKAHKIPVLLLHCAVYSSCFVFFGPKFLLAVFATHFATDIWTSKLTSHFFAKSWRSFFLIIGLDQLIHQITLIVLFHYLVGITPLRY